MGISLLWIFLKHVTYWSYSEAGKYFFQKNFCLQYFFPGKIFFQTKSFFLDKSGITQSRDPKQVLWLGRTAHIYEKEPIGIVGGLNGIRLVIPPHFDQVVTITWHIHCESEFKAKSNEELSNTDSDAKRIKNPYQYPKRDEIWHFWRGFAEFLFNLSSHF